MVTALAAMMSYHPAKNTQATVRSNDEKNITNGCF
jgi:hypothetical protein